MDKKRWLNLSFAEQIGNIGSEISRARHWEEKDDKLNRNRALMRIMAYLDLMLEQRQSLGRYKELARLREVLGDWFSDRHVYDVSPQDLEDYCIPFALKGRSSN